MEAFGPARVLAQSVFDCLGRSQVLHNQTLARHRKNDIEEPTLKWGCGACDPARRVPAGGSLNDQ